MAGRYGAGHLSLRGAAGRLALSLSDTLDRLQRLGVTGNVTVDTLLSLASLSDR